MKKVALGLAVAIIWLGGCTDAHMQQIESLGSNHKVTLYATDGHVINQWTATGNVANEAQSDGWYFRDSETGKLVEVTGTLVIEQE
jgi:hypothetical protein